MSRTHLRLVEPIQEGQSFPEFNATGKSTEISQPERVAAALQLFLLWPDYSSCLVRSPDGKTMAAKMSIDPDLKEVEDLLLAVDQQVYSALKAAATRELEIIFEVFGITHSFRAAIRDIAPEYSQDAPVIAVEVPTRILQLSSRGDRRRRLEKSLKTLIRSTDSQVAYSCLLVEVSPTAMLLSFESANIQCTDLVEIQCEKFKFKAMRKVSRPGEVVISPIPESPEDFGPYFDLYASIVYPMLRNRHAFPLDPFPDIAKKTGQIKKFAAREQSDAWDQGVSEAYLASKDAQHRYAADYVAVDESGEPIGTSCLTYAFEDATGCPIWAFHSLGVLADPKYLRHTAAVYMWRADYLLAKSHDARVVVWFDGKGRWLEKVYAKFQALTPSETLFSKVSMIRYTREATQPNNIGSNPLDWRTAEIVEGRFHRFIASKGTSVAGAGQPYLHLAGGLELGFSLSATQITSDDIKAFQGIIHSKSLFRFYCAIAHDQAVPEISGYNSSLIDTVSRQVSSRVRAMSHFASSLEHSQAVTSRKYDSG